MTSILNIDELAWFDVEDGNKGRDRRLEGRFNDSSCMDSASLGIDPHRRTFTFTCDCAVWLGSIDAVMVIEYIFGVKKMWGGRSCERTRIFQVFLAKKGKRRAKEGRVWNPRQLIQTISLYYIIEVGKAWR